MKKLLALGLLSMAVLGGATGSASAFFGHCCCNKCCMTICCRQYNAFTPVCCGSICCMGCCPWTPCCCPPPPCPPPCDCCAPPCDSCGCGGYADGVLPPGPGPMSVFAANAPATGGFASAPGPLPLAPPGSFASALPPSGSTELPPANNGGAPNFVAPMPSPADNGPMAPTSQAWPNAMRRPMVQPVGYWPGYYGQPYAGYPANTYARPYNGYPMGYYPRPNYGYPTNNMPAYPQVPYTWGTGYGYPRY